MKQLEQMAGNAGDVGKAVTGNPGYSGFCPSWSQPLIPINCGVNERMPLEKRTAPSQTPKDSNPLPSDPDKTGYLLPKRTLASTIYSTDSAQSTAAIEKPKTYTRLNPCPYSVSQLPEHIPFNASTTLNAMHNDVCHDNSPKDFFSNMVKKRSDTSGSLPDLSRRTEGKSISVRGRSGAEGINSLRQAQGVPKETDFEVPKPGYRSGSRGPPGSSEMFAATDVVKFINAAPQVSSYTREYGAVGENLKDRLPRFPGETSERSSTADLFPGTSKAVYYDKLPGFMGHVPSNPRNLAMIKGDNDPLNGHHKDTLLITTDNCPAGYSGHRPRAVTNDRGRDLQAAGDLTTSGASAKYVASDMSEKSMNTREHAKLHATKSFFTRGGGEDSAQMCDLFFQRYRPYEGLMKHGNPMDTTWNGDKQRRTTVPVS